MLCLGFQFIPKLFLHIGYWFGHVKTVFWHWAIPPSKIILKRRWKYDYAIKYFIFTFHVTFGSDIYSCNQHDHFLVQLYWHCCPVFRISGLILTCAKPNVLEHDIGDWAQIQQHAYLVNPEKREKLRSEVESYYGYRRSFLLKSVRGKENLVADYLWGGQSKRFVFCVEPACLFGVLSLILFRIETALLVRGS